MTNPEGPGAHDFIAPPPQEVTHPEQETDLAESATSDQPAAELSPIDDGANQSSNITRTLPETTPTQPDIPPHLREAAGKAIDSLLVDSSGRMISFGRLLHVAFGDELLSPQEFAHFKRALNQDPRTRYKGKGRYLI